MCILLPTPGNICGRVIGAVWWCVAVLMFAAPPTAAQAKLSADDLPAWPEAYPHFQSIPELSAALRSGEAAARSRNPDGIREAERALVDYLIRLPRRSASAESARYIETARWWSLSGKHDEAESDAAAALGLARESIAGFLFYENTVKSRLGFRDSLNEPARIVLSLAHRVRAEAAGKVRYAFEDLAFEAAQLQLLNSGAAAITNKRAADWFPDALARSARLSSDLRRGMEYLSRVTEAIESGYYGPGGERFYEGQGAVIEKFLDAMVHAARTLRETAPSLEDYILPPLIDRHMVMRDLREGEAFLMLAVDDAQRVHAFLLRHGSWQWAVLPVGARQLMQMQEQLREGLGVHKGRGVTALAEPVSPLDAGLVAQSIALYDALLRPFEAELRRVGRLYVASPGGLLSVPLEMLARDPGPSSDLASVHWLVKDMSVSILPIPFMLSKKARSAPPRRHPQPLPFFAMADPDYDALRGQGHIPGAAQGLVDLAPLPESEEEARVIARDLGAELKHVHMGGEANEARLFRETGGPLFPKLSRLARFRFMLFATHGLVAGDLPGLQEPALALTPHAETLWDLPVPLQGTMPRTDGLLTAGELVNLDLMAELVILSACNSASPSGASQDGFSGIALPFAAAGAGAIMASQWQVVSRAATELTTATIANLSQGGGRLDAAEALRRAELSILSQGGEKAHPRYWAPFSVFGGPPSDGP